MRLVRRAGYAVAVVRDRVDARVVCEAEFRKHVERPQRSRRDRVAGRAVQSRAYSASGLDGILRLARVLPELFGTEVVHQPVPEAMAADLMTSRGDLAHQSWVALRHPAKYEERPPRV